eukprot:5386484-Amphidinium_carterae.3
MILPPQDEDMPSPKGSFNSQKNAHLPPLLPPRMEFQLDAGGCRGPRIRSTCVAHSKASASAELTMDNVCMALLSLPSTMVTAGHERKPKGPIRRQLYRIEVSLFISG